MPRRGRPGGNPDLVKHQFTAKGDEPLVQKITIRISDSMFNKLQEKDNYREFCRQAIAEALARDERLAEKLKRDSQSS
ncbi:MAG: hypothetical protein PUP93_29420 [Rhizonema sp. NSF051]|nr:hypothetical protein [Rhizonema sp. NSF051]